LLASTPFLVNISPYFSNFNLYCDNDKNKQHYYLQQSSDTFICIASYQLLSTQLDFIGLRLSERVGMKSIRMSLGFLYIPHEGNF
jgi:hypothetical protein